MKKKNIVVILVVLLCLVVLVGGYFLGSKLAKTNGEKSNNNANNMNGNEQEVAISNGGEVLEFALGRLVVDTTGEVYYMTRDDTNLGSEKIYTTSVYQTQPDSYEFMGYKLNVSNIRSLYVMQLGNDPVDYYVYLIDKSGNVSVIKFSAQDGTNTIGEEIKLTQYKDIVSIVPTSDFGGHSALTIDKNGNLYNIVTSTETEVKNVTDTIGEVLEFTFGKIIVDTTGEVYYVPISSANLYGSEAILNGNTRLGSQKEYITKSYLTGPNTYDIKGYKLNYADVKSAYAAYIGNGADTEYVFLLDKSGKMYMLKFSIENKLYDLVEEKELTQYKDIVSVVPTGGFDGRRALAIDKNGNLYDLFG